MNWFKNIQHQILSKTSFVNFTIIISIFFLDRITKVKIIAHQENNNIIFVNDYLNLELIWNTGIGFGLLSLDANLFYHLITLLIFFVIIFLFYVIYKSSYVDKILFSLVLGGALGNFYDRILYFAVPDFIDLHYNDFHWFTFNIADIFISVGIILHIVKDLIFKKNEI
tara:strand:+ start:31 stop:534 length:504 start_codon:yes stop_codon:yes gene_type:complete